jgi:hypothetical protein
MGPQYLFTKMILSRHWLFIFMVIDVMLSSFSVYEFSLVRVLQNGTSLGHFREITKLFSQKWPSNVPIDYARGYFPEMAEWCSDWCGTTTIPPYSKGRFFR